MENEASWNKAAVASLVLPTVTIGTIAVLASTDYSIPALKGYGEYCYIAVTLAGLALSILALISYKQGQIGMLMAVCGLILNGLMLMPILLQCPDCRHAEAHARRSNCASNLKQVGTALLMYSQDYDGHLPPRGIWNKAVYDASKNRAVLICPEDKSGKPSYAINRALISLDITKIDDTAGIIMLFECAPGENRVGGVEMAEYRHEKTCNAGFADGHVKWFPEKDIRDYMNRNIETQETERK